MKIIRKSNVGTETVSDVQVASNLSIYYAEKITKFLNDGEGPDSREVYEMHENYYKLYKWEP